MISKEKNEISDLFRNDIGVAFHGWGGGSVSSEISEELDSRGLSSSWLQSTSCLLSWRPKDRYHLTLGSFTEKGGGGEGGRAWAVSLMGAGGAGERGEGWVRQARGREGEVLGRFTMGEVQVGGGGRWVLWWWGGSSLVCLSL